MGRFRNNIKADAHRDARTAPDEPATTDTSATSPFSMDYETEQYALDSESVDQMLTVAVALTNLL